MVTARSWLPPQACDCHLHICDTKNFPVAATSGYLPPYAPLSAQRSMLEAVGFTRSVAVQTVAYGDNNAGLTNALSASEGTMRGIATCFARVTDGELERLHRSGVRGLRFYLATPRALPGIQLQGAGIADLEALAARMQALGWVAEISSTCEGIVEIAPRLLALRLPLVLEHMGGCAPGKGIDDPKVQRLLGLLSTGCFWIKLTTSGLSVRSPDYEDLRPLHDSFLAAAPDRLVWGSDWPHIPQVIKGEQIPDVGHLIDTFDVWIDHDTGLRRRILSDNPAHLFGF